MFYLLCVLITTVTVGSTDLNKSIFPSLPVAIENSENVLCQTQSEIYVKYLNNFTLWAYEMWDSTAKSSSGVLKGSIYQMGHFEECLNAEAPFLTQYCLPTIIAHIPDRNNSRDPIALYHPPQEFVLDRLYPYQDVSQQKRNMIKLGWCLPASCKTQDVETFLNSYMNQIDLPLLKNNVTYTASLPSLLCHTKEDNRFYNPADYIFLLLMLLLILFVLAATCCDFNSNPKESDDEKTEQKSLIYRLFLTFSARENFNDLTRMDESNSALTILYGMRTICIFFIILDHRFGTFVSSALLNFDYVETQYRAPLAPLLFHGDLFVDSFFVLSGLLGTYGLLGQLDKNKINPGFLIFMRYVRLTPVYAFVVFYYATLFNYTGTGPLWKVIAGQDSQDCKQNWWTNLLYISNYVNADHMCMTHSWYLPCDFHYFIIGIGLCLLINKNKKLGLFILFLFTVLSILIPFALTIAFMRPALLHFYPEFLTGPKIHPDFLLTYSKSHTRATPYFIGMFAGYSYYKLKGSTKHICRLKSYAILLVSIILILVAIIGGAVFYNPYHKYNPYESAAYAAFHRPAFAIGSFGILYVSSYGHASFIYKVLTWFPWVPLSKLVYGAYLMHMQFQLRSAARFMSPRQISYFDVVISNPVYWWDIPYRDKMCLALSDIVLAFISALVLYLLIEAPFRRIFREVMMPQKKKVPPRGVNLMNGNGDSRL